MQNKQAFLFPCIFVALPGSIINLLNNRFMKIGTLLAFAGGVVAGGVILMMLAPHSRSEMCENFKKKMGEAKKCVDEAVAGCHLSGSCAVSPKENSDAM